MHFYIHYFIDSNFKSRKNFVNRLSEGKFVKDLYIVCFVNKSDRLEIISSLMFKQKYFKELNIEIVALCKGMDSAVEFIRQLSEVSVRMFNDFLPRKCLEVIDEGDINI